MGVIAGLAVRRGGDGPPIVLVHGTAGGLDSFGPVTPLLEGYASWVFARRGYAPSEGCRRPKSFADDVADIEAVLAAVGEPAHLLGVSYGAYACLHAALAGRAPLRSLTVFEPPLFAAGPATAAVVEDYRALVERGDLHAANLLFAERVAQVPRVIIDALAAGGGAEPSVQEAVGTLHDLEALGADSTDLDRWSGIGLPVLVMQGEQTWPPVPAAMDSLARVLPDPTRAVLDGQSHFATHTAPELFAGTVLRFLHDHE
jgi:pimeloyl-ACP methyl ester carboxylesterase